jgi:glycerophosphoryl diester phosphodiesterase
MKTGLSSRTRGDFLTLWRQPLAFHLLMQLLGVAFFTPLISGIANHLVAATGEHVISNYDIAAFALSFRGAVFILVVAALTIGLLFAEFAGLSWIAGHAIMRRPVTMTSTIGFVARHLPALVALSARVFLRLAVLLLPFLAVAALVWVTTLAGNDVNYYLSENPPPWQRAKLAAAALVLAYAALAVRQLTRWLFAVPALLYEGLTPPQALRRSALMTRGRLRSILVPLALWWLLLPGAAFLVALTGREIAAAGLAWAGIDVRRVLPLVALFLTVSAIGGVLYGALQLAGHQFLITRMYAEQTDAKWKVPPQLEMAEESARRLARPMVMVIVALLVLALGVAALMTIRLDLKRDVAVTAHRGASVAAPENTMASFRRALEAGADFIELDVQRTRDGQVVVVHDGDLMRMAGDPRKIVALTVEDLASIDIGRTYAPEFAGEHVPTLAEVIGLTRGRAKINIELKYNVPDPALAPAVLEVLKRENFLDQVVITSLDQAALKQVEAGGPGPQTGLIVTAAMGNVVQTAADFLSLNSAQATPSLLRRAHAAGKAVHVWTVNKPEVMLRMIERGVDNIITDDPGLLKKVMRERNTLSRPEILGLGLRVLFGKAPPEVVAASAVPQL